MASSSAPQRGRASVAVGSKAEVPPAGSAATHTIPFRADRDQNARAIAEACYDCRASARLSSARCVAPGALWQPELPASRARARSGVAAWSAMSVDIPPGGTRGAKAPPGGAVGRMLMGVARRVHRLTGSKMSGRPLLYLTTLGANSGQPRTAVVMPFPEGDDAWLIVASANGAARHPAWLHNLAAHPDRVEIEFEGRKTAATPQTLSGEECATAWERITRERPSFAAYEHKTDRDIPIVRLRAR